MRVRDLQPGTKVYHNVFVHLGQGTVVNVVAANGLERMFEKGRGSWRVIVEFENGGSEFVKGNWTPACAGEVRCYPSQLVRKPDKKRIEYMRSNKWRFNIAMPTT